MATLFFGIRKTEFYKIFLFGLVFAFFSGHVALGEDSSEMYRLASALTKLSAAIEAEARYSPDFASMTEKEIIFNATIDDPSLLAPFRNYIIRVRTGNRHSVVLICSREHKALLEDTACTGNLDVHRWQSVPLENCEFSLRVERICR